MLDDCIHVIDIAERYVDPRLIDSAGVGVGLVPANGGIPWLPVIVGYRKGLMRWALLLLCLLGGEHGETNELEQEPARVLAERADVPRLAAPHQSGFEVPPDKHGGRDESVEPHVQRL